MLWRGDKGGKSGRVHSLRPSIGTRPLFRSFLARRALLNQQSLHAYTLLQQPPHTRNNALLTQGAPSSRGSGMGSGQSPVVNILITTSALQNCCHHSRTHHWRRGQSRQLSAGLWFNFIDELADLFLHHRRRDHPPRSASTTPLHSSPLPSSHTPLHSPRTHASTFAHTQPLSPRQVRYCAAWNSSRSGATPG